MNKGRVRERSKKERREKLTSVSSTTTRIASTKDKFRDVDWGVFDYHSPDHVPFSLLALETKDDGLKTTGNSRQPLSTGQILWRITSTQRGRRCSVLESAQK